MDDRCDPARPQFFYNAECPLTRRAANRIAKGKEMDGHGLLCLRVERESVLYIREVGILIFLHPLPIGDLSPRLVMVIVKAFPYLSPDERDRKPVRPEFEIRRYRDVVEELS